jgi:hypothetical protein
MDAPVLKKSRTGNSFAVPQTSGAKKVKYTQSMIEEEADQRDKHVSFVVY